jgi:tetratricopeptide (TPR) repeat protein
VRPFARVLIALLVAAVVAVGAASCGKKNKKAEEPKTAEGYLKRAQNNFLNATEAIKDCDKAIELDKNFTPAYEFRAERYEERFKNTQRAEDARKAVADYDALMRLEPHSPKAAERLRSRGLLKLRTDDSDGAIADFKASLAKRKGESKTYEYLAEAYRAKDDMQTAVQAYGLAIKYDPGNAHLYSLRAEVYRALKDYDNAIADLGKVIELQPDYLAYARRAELYRELGQPQKALDDYEKAKSLNPSLGEGGTVW